MTVTRITILMLSVATAVLVLAGISSAGPDHRSAPRDVMGIAVSDTNEAPAKIVGTVSDTAGNPVAMASVYFEDTKVGATTSGSGRYVITGAPTGEQTLVCAARGMKKLTRSITIEPATVDTVNLVLQAK